MQPLGARFRAIALAALLVSVSVVSLGGNVFGLSSGISEELDKGAPGGSLAKGGCSCHNAAYTGNVVAVLEGVPSFYAFKDKLETGPFTLNVSLRGGPAGGGSTGHVAGFNLQVTDGELKVPAGAADVQVFNPKEAGHTTAGNKQRSWSVQWTPPTHAGSDVVFTLTVNAVNGNGVNDPADEWGRATVVSQGTQGLPGAAEGGSPVAQVRALGVNFYAYWVGVISFIVLFLVIAATFFLLRYGESRHWTDQKDRPVKDKPETPPKMTGTWVVLGIVLIVFLVAAVQVLRVV